MQNMSFCENWCEKIVKNQEVVLNISLISKSLSINLQLIVYLMFVF